MSGQTECAIYARKSSVQQRQASIEVQIRRSKEFALSRGWHVLDEHIYVDDSRSAATANQREAFREMIAVALSRDCPFQRIIVDDTSRIARNTREALDVFSLLTFYGINVNYISQGIDTASETAEEVITINGMIDSLFLRNLAMKTHEGLEDQIRKGYSAGGKKYGYYSEPVFNGKVDIYGNPLADGYILRINYEEAQTINRIFRMYAEDCYGARKIANILNKELKETGQSKSPGGKYWRFTTILGRKRPYGGILNNELYIGVYRWNRTKAKINPQTDTKTKIMRPPNQEIVILKPELRIIDDELWHKVKKRQKSVSEASNEKYWKGKASYSLNLLTGLIKCSVCGSNFVVVYGGKYGKYGCSNNFARGDAVCPNANRIDRRCLEDIIINQLPLDLDEAAQVYLMKKANNLIRYHEKLSTGLKSQKSIIEKQIIKVSREIDNYIRAISVGFTTDVVKNALKNAESRLQKLQNDLAMSQNIVPFRKDISRQTVMEYLSNISRTLRMNIPSSRQLLQTYFRSIDIMHDGPTFSLRFSHEEGTKVLAR